MNVILISPPRNYPMKNEMYPSGALLMLGTLLKKQGHKVKVIHMVADKINEDKLEDIILESYPDVVGFTVSTYQTKWTRLLMDRIKILSRSRIKITAGGPHPTALGAKFMDDFPDVDITVCGEGEKAMSDIANGVPLEKINGIHYRRLDVVVSTDPAPLRANLDKLPLPNINLIDFNRYGGLFPVGRRPSMFIMSSRGCPYRCKFCSKSIYGNTLRLRSPENIMEEVELLYKMWGVREIHFGDDTFNANRQWADKLLYLMIRKGYHKKVVSRVALRVNKKILDLELLRHLKAAGVWLACYGVESGNQGMLDSMGKDITIEEIKRAFDLTHHAGIKTEAYFIIGMPGETRQTIQQTLDLYREIKPYWGGFSRAMPFPGTAFTIEAKEAGHLLCEDYEQYGPSCMAVRTESLTAGEINQWVNALNGIARRDKMKHTKQVLYALRDKTYRG